MFKERFLKYVSFDTQSNDASETIPSTLKQRKLGEYLTNELHSLGVENAYLDEFGYVYGYIPTNCNKETTLGLIAHMDTSDEASGANIHPQFVNNYQGQVIKLNDTMSLDPKEFPRLLKQIGHDLITTDGTTLLGADDKSGVAIIMTIVELIHTKNIQHPNLIVTFTPDEEVGRGTLKFNYKYYKEHNCSLAYTLDGGEPEFINYENFNAASAKVTITGKSIHPGSAKNTMINSMLIGMEFNSMLPAGMIPSLTADHEGFNHLTDINGTCSETTLNYIIRNHDSKIFETQKQQFLDIKDFLNKKYGHELVKVEINDSYYNMKELILKNPILLDVAEQAIKNVGLVPVYDPIRGGTDGAHLTYDGILTPNLGTGGQNYHGPYEYLDLNEAESMINIVQEIFKLLK